MTGRLKIRALRIAERNLFLQLWIILNRLHILAIIIFLSLGSLLLFLRLDFAEWISADF